MAKEHATSMRTLNMFLVYCYEKEVDDVYASEQSDIENMMKVNKFWFMLFVNRMCYG